MRKTATATPEFMEAQKTKKPCKGCDKCGDADEAVLYSHQHDGRYLCSKCFFMTKPGQRWPEPKATKPTARETTDSWLTEEKKMDQTLPIDMDRVKFFLKLMRNKAREAGKTDMKRSNIPDAETQAANALGAAVVEALGGEPDVTFEKGRNDGDFDGMIGDKTYDVKGVYVRTNWDGIDGFNDIKHEDGRVRADLIVAAMCSRDMAQAVGWAFRHDPMGMVKGFDRPAYTRRSLRPMGQLVKKLESLK